MGSFSDERRGRDSRSRAPRDGRGRPSAPKTPQRRPRQRIAEPLSSQESYDSMRRSRASYERARASRDVLDEARRAAGEARPEVPRQIRAPGYLPDGDREAFTELGKKLRDCGLFTVLDGDALARYLLARRSWLEATMDVLEVQRGGAGEDGQRTVDLERLESASRIQDRFFKQCQRAAADLGLTVTSRCRLVLPEGAQMEENPLETLLRERMERA